MQKIEFLASRFGGAKVVFDLFLTDFDADQCNVRRFAVIYQCWILPQWFK